MEPHPRKMKQPCQKGLVFAHLMNTLKLSRFFKESTCRSAIVRCTAGSKGPFIVNSPALRNLKKPKQQASHSMTLSGVEKSKELCTMAQRSAVKG